MKFIHLFLLLAVVSFVNCKKETTTAALTKKQILTGSASKSWVISKIVSTFNGISTDATSLFAACDKDNFTTYKMDGSALHDEGATKCDPADPQTVTGTYSFNADETQLTVTESGVGTITVKVLELTSTKFTAEASITVAGQTAFTTTTYVPR